MRATPKDMNEGMGERNQKGKGNLEEGKERGKGRAILKRGEGEGQS